MGFYFLVSQKISINESIFEIFPSNFLCVIPIGETKGLCNLKLVSAMLFHSMRHKESILTKLMLQTHLASQK